MNLMAEPRGDVARGAQTPDVRPHAFTRADGIERLWEEATPLLESPPPVQRYAAGSWGPDAVHDLIAPRRWHLPD